MRFGVGLFGQTLIIILVVGISYYQTILRSRIKTLENELARSDSEIMSKYKYKDNFKKVIKNLYHTEKYKDLESNIRGLPFPVPKEKGTQTEDDQKVSDLVNFLGNYPLAFAGAEQFILEIFPSDKLAASLLPAIQSLSKNASNAVLENIESMNSSISEGFVNIQDSEVLYESIKGFVHGFLESIKNPLYNISLSHAIESNSFLKFSSSLLNKEILTETLDPLINLTGLISDVKDSWVDNMSDSFHEISDQYNSVEPSNSHHRFPYVTLLLSGIREVKLLDKGKTNVANSIKNISLDVTGTGLGAFGGAKAGAIAGTLFGPPGVVAGGILGAAIGAIGGRFISDKVKYMPLKEAISEYDRQYNNMKKDLDNCLIMFEENVLSTSAKSKENYMDSITSIPYPDLSVVIKKCYKLRSSYLRSLRAFKNGLFFLKLFHSSISKTHRKDIENIEAEIKNVVQHIPSNANIESFPVKSLLIILDLKYPKNGNYASDLEEAYREFNFRNKSSQTVLFSWCFNAFYHYKVAMKSIVNELEKEANQYYEKCQSWKETLKMKEQKIYSEKERLGK